MVRAVVVTPNDKGNRPAALTATEKQSTCRRVRLTARLGHGGQVGERRKTSGTDKDVAIGEHAPKRLAQRLSDQADYRYFTEATAQRVLTATAPATAGWTR
jgi:hypothetical protein